MKVTIHTAKEDLKIRCALCRARIDRGDTYRIVPQVGGFDYAHADCRKTAFIGALDRAKQDPKRPLKVQGA